MTVHVNGTDLMVERTGAGRTLVMVHGNGEDHTIFDEAVGVLKEDFDCVCPDSRGHGGSAPVSEFHYEDMAEDVIALMEALDLRDAVFYGFSDGGIVGLLAAARCSRISTLIVSGANVTPRGVSRPYRGWCGPTSSAAYRRPCGRSCRWNTPRRRYPAIPRRPPGR